MIFLGVVVGGSYPLFLAVAESPSDRYASFHLGLSGNRLLPVMTQLGETQLNVLFFGSLFALLYIRLFLIKRNLSSMLSWVAVPIFWSLPIKSPHSLTGMHFF